MIDGFLDGVRNATPDVGKVFNTAIPDMSPALAVSGASAGGSMTRNINTTQTINNNQNVTVEVPVILDGKEVARITAPYTSRELHKQQITRGRGLGNG
ncbi:hypothetical protein [Anaerovirgula multivorans]|nr:hypothetical protein [Anaerovirgula multivorans]